MLFKMHGEVYVMESKVTVLIPFYNPGEYIFEALDSVFAQTFKNWKIILIDDASTDNTVSMIQGYLNDPRIKLVRHSQNMGQSKSMNTGLELVETPFLVQLDADDWFCPHTLEVLMGEAEKQPDDVGVFSGNINVVFDNVERRPIQKKSRKKRSYKERDAQEKQDQVEVRKGRFFKDRYDFLMANTSVWPRFYRTSALKSIEGWPTDDPYDGRYAEDSRVLLRLIEHYRFHWIDEVLLNHRRHSQNQTNMIDMYNNILEWLIHDTLKRWGDKYEPIFKYSDGWLKITELKPKN